MRVEPFKIGDYVKARFVNGIGFENWHLNGGVIPVLLLMERSGTFWTVWEEDNVILIAGWYTVWNRLCEVSLFPTEYFVKKPFGALRLIKKELKELIKKYPRVQLNCRNEEVFVDFATRLGFQQEGILRGYGYDGCDHIIMSIVEGIWQKQHY